MRILKIVHHSGGHFVESRVLGQERRDVRKECRGHIFDNPSIRATVMILERPDTRRVKIATAVADIHRASPRRLIYLSRLIHGAAT